MPAGGIPAASAAESLFGLQLQPHRYVAALFEIAQDFTFANYIWWAVNKGRGGIVIRDYQVVHLSGASWRTDHILDAKACDSDLEEACRLLSDWGIAGVVEQFELSARVFQALYSPQLPGLEFVPRWENATLREPPPMQERLDQLKSMLGEALYADFMEINQLDLALYQHAQSLLANAARRLELTIPDAEAASQPLAMQAP